MAPLRGRALAERLYPTLESGVDAIGRTIYLFGPIAEDRAARTAAALGVLALGEGPTRIVLSSPGGDVDAGMAIYDAIRLHPHPVIVDVIGQAQSAAVLVLQAGSLRRLSPEARVMVHEGQAGVEGVTPRTLAQIAAEVQFMFGRYEAILAQRSGKPLAEMRRLCSQESYMSAGQAVAIGLADEVLTTHNPMAVSVRKVRRKR